MSLLGLDIQPNGCTALVLSVEGLPVAQARRDYQASISARGARVLDVPQVWAAICEAIQDVAQRTSRDPVRALSVSAMGEALVPVSAEGHILGDCLLEAQPGAIECAQKAVERLGEDRLAEITGSFLGYSSSFPNVCWLRRNDPETYQRVWRFLPWTSLVVFLLGGASLCDYSLAGRTLLFDVSHQRWAGEVLDSCAVAEHKLPELAPAGTPAGTISTAMARQLGLQPGVQLVLGGHERCCSALGVGAIRDGMAVYTMAAVVGLIPIFQAIPLVSLMWAQGFETQRHVVPDSFVSFLYTRAGAGLLNWFRDTLTPAELRTAARRGATALDELLSRLPAGPTDLLVLPQLWPPSAGHVDEEASGAILGLKAGTTREELLKALLEGLSLFFAEGKRLLESAAVRVCVLRAVGPGVRASAWLQLTADVLGIPVELTGALSAAPLGAALLAGIGCRAYAGFAQAVDSTVHVHTRFDPDAGRNALYSARLDQYRSLCTLLAPQLRDLARPGAGYRPNS